MGVNEKFRSFVSSCSITVLQALERDWSDVQRCRLMSTMTSGPKVTDLATYPFLQPFILHIDNEAGATMQLTVTRPESDASPNSLRHSPESVIQSIQNLSQVLHDESMDIANSHASTVGVSLKNEGDAAIHVRT
jgi:hypothetical protein